MLYDCERTKSFETAQHKTEKTGIQKISGLAMTKVGASQFAQSGRETAPGIGIGNWIEGKRNALPNRPRKDKDERNPITNSPKRIGSQARRLPAGELGDHLSKCGKC